MRQGAPGDKSAMEDTVVRRTLAIRSKSIPPPQETEPNGMLPANPPNSPRALLCSICPQIEEQTAAVAEFACEDCKDKFCIRCAKRHTENTIFAKHSVVLISPEPDQGDLENLTCREHSQRTLQYYCHGCNMAACALCVSFCHGGKGHLIDHARVLDQKRRVLLVKFERSLRTGPVAPPLIVRVPSHVAERRPVPRLLWKKETGQTDLLGSRGPGDLSGPADLAFLPNGQVVVADRWNRCVQLFAADGTEATVQLSGVAPLRICVTAGGLVAVVDDYDGGCIKTFAVDEHIQIVTSKQECAKSGLGKSEARNPEADTGNDSSEIPKKGHQPEKAEDRHNGDANMGKSPADDLMGLNVAEEPGERPTGVADNEAEPVMKSENCEKVAEDDNKLRVSEGSPSEIDLKADDRVSTSMEKGGRPTETHGSVDGGRSSAEDNGFDETSDTKETTPTDQPGTVEHDGGAPPTTPEVIGVGGTSGDLTVNITDNDSLLYTKWKPKGTNRPWAIAVTKSNTWVISGYVQYVSATIGIYKHNGDWVRTFGGYGEDVDQIEWPGYLATDSKDRVIVSDYWSHYVKVFDSHGNFIRKVGLGWGKKNGHMTFPKGVCVDDEDNILVVDSGNNRISEFTSDGLFIRNALTAKDGLVGPEGIAFIKIENCFNGSAENTAPEEGDRLERRLGVTMCKGREYSGLFVYGLDEVER